MSKLFKRTTFYALAIALFAAVGIGSTFNPFSSEAGKVAALQVEGVETQPFVKGSLTSIVTARSGRPFLVVFWSTYCGVCMAEMDVWRALLEERDDFEVVMVSTNDIEMADRLNAILNEKGLMGVESWAFADPIPARVRASVDKAWRGTLPYIRVYDRDGSVTASTGSMHKEDVEAWLDSQAG